MAYKMALLLKGVVSVLVPEKARQKAKLYMLKKAYPLNILKSPAIGQYERGINLLGYARAEMGIGESCRIAARSVNAAGIPFGIINFIGTNKARMTDTSWAHKEVTSPEFGINVFHLNAEQMTEVYAQYGNHLFNGRYNIGYWHWELPDFPDRWLESFRLVNEIWVPSTFVLDSIALKSPVPVLKIPHSIQVDIEEPRNREYFGLPADAFLFLTMYDAKSYQERKNPLASIEAFKQSFEAHDTNVCLVIKVNSYNHYSNEVQLLHNSIAGYANIIVLNEVYSRNDTNALLSVVDSYISLHRSEGFGLGLAEAMYLRKPVIGTAWSGNTDFMNFTNSCLVNFELIRLNKDYGPYEAYQYWAEPDIAHAAEYMGKLVHDRIFYDRIAQAGENYIKTHHSPRKVGELIKKRLNYIGESSDGGTT